MSRTPARCTQADINRAMKVVAMYDGFRVRLSGNGDIVIERGEKPEIQPPVDERPKYAL